MMEQSKVHVAFQKSLEPFIKPREQVNYIRRVLALHLGSCSNDGPIKQPVSLADSSNDVAVGPELKGIQREYIEALSANIAARRKHAEVAQGNPSRPSSPKEPQPSNGIDIVEERIALLKIQGKQERLTTVQQCLDELIEKPAGSVEFLDPEDMFRDAAELPSVPKEVVNSLVAQQTAPAPDLQSQVSQLEKTVLRAKLLLRKEEQLLREARASSQNIPDVLSNGTRLDALNVTRNELINWIESELGKASVGEDGEEHGHDTSKIRDQMAANSATVNSQLVVIKDKYSRYLAARRSLLATLAERSGASQPPVLKAPEAQRQSAIEPDPAPSNYLLTPYIETLISLSRSQKSAITQKSYMNSTIGRETRDACQVLNHLAEESQLLPEYPQTGPSRRRSGLGEVLGSSQRSGFTGEVQPWVYAADAAKITTLETVMEKVEGGQVALENSMQTLREIDHLLGQEEADESQSPREDLTENDMWLNTGSKKSTNTRRHTVKKKPVEKAPKDVWSGLNGKLGLIGHEDAV